MVAFIQKNYPDAFPRTRFSSIAQPAEKIPSGYVTHGDGSKPAELRF